MLLWLGQQIHPTAAGFWLVFDWLAAGALWFLLPRMPVRWQSLLRALGWLLVPWLALMAGVVSPQALGLTDIAWQSTLTLGLGIVLTVFALLFAVRATVGTTGRASHAFEDAAGRTTDSALLPSMSGRSLHFYAVLYHGIEQLHWCFQRALVAALLVKLPWTLETPAYWALWIATLLALPGVFRHPSGWVRLHALVALLATAILFFYTRNFWLCWLLHAGILLLAGSAHIRPELNPLRSE